MDKQPENKVSRLDQELEAILAPLGVKQERGRQEASTSRQHEELHIVGLYASKDKGLWSALQPYLDFLKHRYTAISCHAHEIMNDAALHDPRIVDEITDHVVRADIVLLGLSVELALALYEHGHYMYRLLAQRASDQLTRPELIGLRFRAVDWHDSLLLEPMVPGKPIGGHRNRDSAYIQISRAIEWAIEHCMRDSEHDQSF